MNKENFLKEFDSILSDETKRGSTLLLHSCCAPCSSVALCVLRFFFEITVFYYNPNIGEESEYRHRVEEQKRLIRELNDDRFFTGSEEKSKVEAYEIKVLEGPYEPELFYEMVKGYESCPERGERCRICFELRLGKTAEYAYAENFDYFATTLTLSPLKDAALLNEIGRNALGKCDDSEGKTKYLVTDFKKRGGYLKSIELSKMFDLYRQDFCGCVFSKAQREKEKKEKEMC